MRDPYTVLGVSKTANAADVKKAYRKLAKTLHPDRNRSDPKASQKFAELNQAYEILGDEKKRAQFDRGEIDAEGKERFAGFGGRSPQGAHPGFESFHFDFGGGNAGGRQARGGRGFEDLFSGLFGGGGFDAADFAQPSAKAADISATLTITLAEAVRGAERQIGLSNGRTLKVNIPPGTASGSVLRLKGQAGGMTGQQAGDVLLTIDVAEHPLFKMDGKNLRLTLPVTLDEAVLGAKIRVPTLTGAVDVSIPAGSNSGKTLRLKGKGLSTKAGIGDLYIELAVMLPETPDQELKDYAANLRALYPYKVRGPEFYA